VLCAVLIAGCAQRIIPPFPVDATNVVELADTPFYAQETHECGPAALATVLDASGAAVTPDELVPQIFMPGRRGSLQVELIAASRRHQRIPYVLAAQIDALFAEIAAGHPVLVLQDLGVGPLHVWHYAVVIGYAAQTQRIVLRSGTTRRLEMRYADFVRSWQKSEQWALVVLPADELPATADAKRYVESIVPLETLGDIATARTAYATALGRWPTNTLALFGLANAEYRLGDLAAAAATYRALLAQAPDNAIVLNNFAEVLLARGCPNAAADVAMRGRTTTRWVRQSPTPARKRWRPAWRAANATKRNARAKARAAQSELLEDVDDPRQLEDQQHDEDDPDDGEEVAAGRRRGDVLVERLQFAVGQGCDAGLRIARIDAETDHLLTDRILREECIDSFEARVTRHRLAEDRCADHFGVRRWNATEAHEVQAHRADQSGTKRKNVVLGHRKLA
jgi:tetratricopeptide (TPR) repeat protein